MTNIVDTSAETVNAEFDAAEQEIGTEEPTQSVEENNAQAALEEEQRQAEITMATGMIATSLRFTIGSFSGVSIDDQVYNQAAESYAVLIIKYFPGGIFAFLDSFKEEIAAATATLVLIKVVSEATAVKREEEEAKRKAAVSQKNNGEGVSNGQA